MAKAISLDANLIVLLVVGLTDPAYIQKHKRLQSYLVDDFEILKSTIESSKEVVVTPNALSEASNLIRQISEPAKSKIGSVFRGVLRNTKELYVRSADAGVRGEFLRFGLSDSVMLEVAKGDIVLLSVDAKLCLAAQNAGYPAVNFNHLRNL